MNDPANFLTEDYGNDSENGSTGETGSDESGDKGESGTPKTNETVYDEAIFAAVKKPEVRKLMDTFAKSSELDLNNPREFKIARQLAEKEAINQELKLKIDPSPEAKSYLDAFNDPEPGQQTETPQAPAMDETALPEFVKVARAWKSEADFTESLQNAFELPDGPEKNQAVANVMLGFQDRTFHSLYMPMIQKMIESVQQQELGPVLNDVRKSKDRQVRTEVVSKLAEMQGMEDIFELFDNASDGEIEVDGEKVPDTWINRVLAENPFILNISVKGKTPAETYKKTTAAQYSAAHRLMKAQRSSKADGPSANGYVRVGQAIEKSKRDPERTSLNAPSGRVPAGGRKPSVFAPSSSNGEIAMADLFGRR